MRKIFAATVIILISLVTHAQVKPVTETYRASNGQYTVSYYADNIIRLTFLPKGYTKNEQVSDAVILPPKNVHPSLKVKVNGDIVAFNGKTLLINADTTNGYYAFNFALESGEMIFGGGERALPLNRRGYRFNLYNNPWYGYGEGADNLNYSVPFFTSSKGYGLFFDNPSKGFADIGKTDENIFTVGFSSGELSVYVILGKDYKDVLQSYHRLTGAQPLPPLWALGNLMSRFGYTSEAQVKDILSKMEAEHIPVDAVIFDLFWFGDSIKGTLGNLDWINKNKWPDPKKMIGDFKKKGIHTLLVTEPFFVETSVNYAAAKKYLAVDSANRPFYLSDFYFGKGGLIDIFRKDSKDWFWQFYKKQMDMGVEAWWGDLGEPEKHPKGLYHNLQDLGHKRLFAADEVHNIYGHNWTKMLYEKYAKDYPSKRLFSLNRSGFAGSQRYGIFPWTGDVSRSWSGLKAQLPVLLGMSMSGVPYVHSDAGGFAGGEGDHELYVRWLQFASFTPIFRPHGTALFEIEPQAKSFPSEAALFDAPWKGYAKQAIELRYRFLPYNYTLAFKQTKYGAPLISPMYYHYPKDSNAVTAQDQFMWGEKILVAPVIEKGANTRKYYLPEGRWLSLYKEAFSIQAGNKWYEDSVTMESIPFFAAEGSFIMQDFEMFNTHNTSAASSSGPLKIVYHLYAEKPSADSVYFDDGKTRQSIQGNNKFIVFSGKPLKNGEYEIGIRTKGNYRKGVADQLLLMIAGLPKKPVSVLINNKPQELRWKNGILLINLSQKNITQVRIR